MVLFFSFFVCVLCPLPQERKVHRLINQSALAVAKNDLTSSLDIAKDAAKKERALCKFRESKGLTVRCHPSILNVVVFVLTLDGDIFSFFFCFCFFLLFGAVFNVLIGTN